MKSFISSVRIRLKSFLFSVRSWIQEFVELPGAWEVLKTFCGEVAVLVIVFPLLDTLIGVSDVTARAAAMGWVKLSPLPAGVFLALAIGCAKKQHALEAFESLGKEN